MFLHHYFAEPIALTEIPPESPIVAFDAYWRQIAPPGAIPGRQHLDPTAIPRLIGWLFLVDVLYEAGGKIDFRYRLIGTRNVRLVGYDSTGRRVHEAFAPEAAAVMLSQYRQTVEAARPAFWITDVPNSERTYIRCFRGLYPLARDGTTVDMLAGMLVPTNAQV